MHAGVNQRLAAGGVLTAALALLVACVSSKGGELRVLGSDTMLPLVNALARGFGEVAPGLHVRVEGGGSAAGIAALIDGRTDVGASSRPLTAEEAERLYRRHGRLGVLVQVARDALEVFVHPENPVHNLTMLQLKGIFTGRIRQWEKVGGAEGTIEVLIRAPTSGTHDFFRAVALDGEEYSPFATVAETTEELIELVAENRAAIGYGGMAYGRAGVAVLALDGVAPTVASARAGTYPLSRYLYFITVGPPEGVVKRFLDFCLSAKGQETVREAGFVPLFED